MWDRSQRGESLQRIAQLFDRQHSPVAVSWPSPVDPTAPRTKLATRLSLPGARYSRGGMAAGQSMQLPRQSDEHIPRSAARSGVIGGTRDISGAGPIGRTRGRVDRTRGGGLVARHRRWPRSIPKYRGRPPQGRASSTWGHGRTPGSESSPGAVHGVDGREQRLFPAESPPAMVDRCRCKVAFGHAARVAGYQCHALSGMWGTEKAHAMRSR
jgi:hypothetical protein